ncbi:MAG TPA: hypothetical protein VHG29_14050 [Novosphingobium sp.]|nr:hypothetical protein [Novosphingobium sp.]
MAGLIHRGKRWLYLVHRWIGIVSCLLLAMWFISGVVMMYVPYPSLTAAERMEGLTAIDWGAVEGPPPFASRPAGQPITLEQSSIGPVWRIPGDRDLAVSASDGHAVAVNDQVEAETIAMRFGHAGVRESGLIERDQWTVSGGFDRYRPLWKVALDTADARVLYVASTSGAVVQDTRGRERFWNWLGSVPHWLYPTALRKDQPLWRQVVLWTSGLGIVGAISGMWIGILRARFRRHYKGGRIVPYRGWQRWHHIFGLVGGALLCTWIVSGWLSVDPGRWFASIGLGEAQFAAYAGSTSPPKIDWSRVRTLPVAEGVRRARLFGAAGRWVLALEQPSATTVVDPETLRPLRFAPADLTRRSALLVPGAPIKAAQVLTHADNYWYDAKGPVELPVLRVKFDDARGTWVHLSLATGEVLGELDARRRTYRWVYDGLHRWDFDGLITRRPLWDIWMLIWLIAGTIVSVSGVVVGWRRLALKRRRAIT